jgi:hypothetical protein
MVRASGGRLNHIQADAFNRTTGISENVAQPDMTPTHPEPFPFRWNRNGALDSCFDAFSSREPVTASLENALNRRE